ncbi:MAG: hypothetical protein CSB44_07420 [Gammaproteobacteria bacterium]|nr:MAG: hypothetical protein CSB44_07420 [Gammaproteobacteria bacterium]
MLSDVRRCELPSGSRLHDRVGKGDFLDCFSVQAGASPRQAAELIAAFPGWAGLLLELRRIAVLPFGLLHDGPDHDDKVGPFPVEMDDGQELIAGFDDRHLEFRVSVMSLDGRVHLATWVHPHGVFGRLYLGAIMPFHVLIAREALARVCRDA